MRTLTLAFSLALLAAPAVAQNYYVVPAPNATGNFSSPQVSSFPPANQSFSAFQQQSLQNEQLRLQNELLRQRLQQQR